MALLKTLLRQVTQAWAKYMGIQESPIATTGKQNSTFGTILAMPKGLQEGSRKGQYSTNHGVPLWVFPQGLPLKPFPLHKAAARQWGLTSFISLCHDSARKVEIYYYLPKAYTKASGGQGVPCFSILDQLQAKSDHIPMLTMHQNTMWNSGTLLWTLP